MQSLDPRHSRIEAQRVHRAGGLRIVRADHRLAGMSQLPQMSVGLIDHLIRSGEGEPRLAIGEIPHGHLTPA